MRKTRTRPAWKKPQADSARLEALLDAAAVEFNARGIAGARLAQVAQGVGVSRAALYYYVDSREDLAFRCYQRACLAIAADLDAAQAAERSGLGRVEAFLRLALDPLRSPAVVLSEVPYLPAAQRTRIESLHAHNMRRLQGFIEHGQGDGSVRDCNAHVAAQALFGMVSWVPLAGAYVEGSGAQTRAHAAEALWQLVERGLACDPKFRFECPLDSAAFGFKPGNPFDRRDAAAQKIELLLQTASRLFNRHGIDGTSLDDITAALGATKGTFYQYLDEKKALVVRCVQRAFDLYERFADAAEAHGRTGIERSFIGLHLNCQALAADDPPLSPLTGLEMLPPRALASIRRRAQAIEARFEGFARQGIRDGSYRPFDVRTLSLAGAGAFGWIPKWRGAEDPAPRVIADEVVALFARGLKRRSA